GALSAAVLAAAGPIARTVALRVGLVFAVAGRLRIARIIGRLRRPLVVLLAGLGLGIFVRFGAAFVATLGIPGPAGAFFQAIVTAGVGGILAALGTVHVLLGIELGPSALALGLVAFLGHGVGRIAALLALHLA